MKKEEEEEVKKEVLGWRKKERVGEEEVAREREVMNKKVRRARCCSHMSCQPGQ